MEERVFELLNDLFQDIPTSLLSYDTLRDLIQTYLRNELPLKAYGLENVLSLSNAPSLNQAFVAELAASRIALDLATEAGALTEEEALLADYLENNLTLIFVSITIKHKKVISKR